MEKVNTIELVCPSERAVVGFMPVKPGQQITDHVARTTIRFKKKWTPKEDYQSGYKDGLRLRCPRCSSELYFKNPEASMEDAIKEKLPLIIGGSKFAIPPK